jgi:hypothetical protein
MKTFSSTSSSEDETNERSVKRMGEVNLLSNQTISSSSFNNEDTVNEGAHDEDADDEDTINEGAQDEDADDEATGDEDYHP